MKRYAILLMALPALAQQSPSTFKLMLDAHAPTSEAAQKPSTTATTPKPSPALTDTPSSAVSATDTADQHTLLDELHPSDSALSQANMELLAKNAALSRQVDDLTVQLGVLTEERSGQLFFYGAMTSFVSLVMGFVLAKILERQRWR